MEENYSEVDNQEEPTNLEGVKEVKETKQDSVADKQIELMGKIADKLIKVEDKQNEKTQQDETYTDERRSKKMTNENPQTNSEVVENKEEAAKKPVEEVALKETPKETPKEEPAPLPEPIKEPVKEVVPEPTPEPVKEVVAPEVKAPEVQEPQKQVVELDSSSLNAVADKLGSVVEKLEKAAPMTPVASPENTLSGDDAVAQRLMDKLNSYDDTKGLN